MKNGLIIDIDGNKIYYKNNKVHREDGPAIEFFDGEKHWYINGQYHREDGPAIERADGIKFWYVNDKWIDCETQEEFERLIRLKAFW
jgi:hypothetical protein